jgi:polar amino acid transport system permease protein
VHYVFQFGVVTDNLPILLYGAALTIELSAAAMVIGLIIAIAAVMARTLGPAPVAWVSRGYVAVVRNTPLLVQLFIIYFSMPALGIRIRADNAAIIGMAFNVGAYAAEILRGGIESIPHGQVEAGRALGLSRLQIARFIVLVPAIRAVYPALCSQFILLMLASSVVSTISAEELTAITNTLQSTTFRSFEFYFASTLLYLAMALMFRAVFTAVRWFAFRGWSM